MIPYTRSAHFAYSGNLFGKLVARSASILMNDNVERGKSLLLLL